MMRRFFLALCYAALVTSCSDLQSSVQSLVTGEVGDETYGGRQHFPVSPQRAVAALSAVAPQHGWEVVSTEDEYDSHGQHGKFFRLERTDAGSDKKTMSGVFYEEPRGSYVRISDNNGLPEALTDALVAELKANREYAQ